MAQEQTKKHSLQPWEYNPEAASDAAVQVRSFFGKYGKQEK